MKNLIKHNEFPYHTKDSIRGINIIRNIPSDCLVDLLKDTTGNLDKLSNKIGQNTNPRWLIARIAEELYNRDVIDEIALDFHTRD
jgi:hypothetical protein